MDNNQFIKGKDRIITDYQRNRRAIASGVGAQGFSYEPGFMFDLQNDLEAGTKWKISDLNYAILKDAVDRELKQLGIDYNLAYQAAAIQWETAKAILFSDWEKELNSIKKEQAHEEEVLNLLAIEVSLRGNILISAKSTIDLEIENYRQQIAALDGTTGDYEVQLVQGKLLTAQKKLESIPFIQDLIDVETQILAKNLELIDKQWIIVGKIQDILPKEYEILEIVGQITERQNDIIEAESSLIVTQQELVVAESSRTNDKLDLISAESALVQYKESILRPALEILIDTMDRYVSELAIQVDLYGQIAEVKTDIAGIKVQQAAKEGEILSAKTSLVAVMAQLVVMSEALAEYKAGALTNAINDLINSYVEYTGAIEEQRAIKLAIIEIKTLIAQTNEEGTVLELVNYEKELRSDEQKRLLMTTMLALESQRGSNTLEKYLQENSSLAVYLDNYISTHANIFSNRQASFNDVSASIGVNKSLELDIRQTNDELIEAERMSDVKSRRSSTTRRIREETNTRIAAKGITAYLNHVLTQD